MIQGPQCPASGYCLSMTPMSALLTALENVLETVEATVLATTTGIGTVLEIEKIQEAVIIPSVIKCHTNQGL